MNTFGKSTVASSRSAALRKFKVPGRAPAPLGRPLKVRSGKVQLCLTEDGDFVSKSAKAVSEVPKKKHNISKNDGRNEALPKRNTKHEDLWTRWRQQWPSG